MDGRATRWLALLPLAACATAAPEGGPPPRASASSLAAPGARPRLGACVESVEGRVARVRVQNEAGELVTLPGVVLVSAALLLDVRDERGEPAPLGPPPTPGGPTTDVRADEGFTTEVRLPSELAGRYRVQVRTGGSITNRCAPIDVTL